MKNEMKPSDRKRRVSRLPGTLLAAVGLVGLCGSPAFSQGGTEETKKLLKSVEGTVKSLGAARQQLEKTLTGYNSIMELTAKDTKSAYKDLGNNILDSEKKVGETRLKVDEMNAEAARHFTAWKENAAAITDPSLRKRSEERLADAQARFDKIAAAGKDARQSFDSLMTDLKNQSTFLGSDLNTSAITSLKPDAAKFNTRAQGLLGKIDGVNKMFDDYMSSMKP